MTVERWKQMTAEASMSRADLAALIDQEIGDYRQQMSNLGKDASRACNAVIRALQELRSKVLCTASDHDDNRQQD
jgi:hypothetical protein